MTRRSSAGSGPYVVPAWIAVASIVGLVSALVGDGFWNVLSWVIFATLVIVAVRAWLRRDRRR